MHTNYFTLTSNKSKTVALILCVLEFFWIGGLHRFYVGKFWTGLLWICTGGFFYIGTVLDLIAIVSGSFDDKSGLPLKQ
ncbi:MAG: TM2 domain-containing protein [Ruminococcus sp.]|nr:TM2 domain-containing protein [Ruminococcus sp.]